MSITKAMQVAVAGLRSNASAVGKVSENIANAGTTGYKRSFDNFVTVSPGGGSGSSVRVNGVQTVAESGTLANTSSVTDLAIAGSGYFVVSRVANPVNATDFFLTRAGSFLPDADGNLVNAAGYYLAGFQADPYGDIGAVDTSSFASLRTVKVSDPGVTATPSSASSVIGNLPAGDTGTGVATSPLVSTLTYANPLGGAESLRLSWQASSTDANKWVLSISDAAGTVYGGVEASFHDSGATPGAPLSYAAVPNAALPPPAAFALDPATGQVTLTLNNGAVPQVLTLDLGLPGSYSGITQFAGDYIPQQFDTDGRTVSAMKETEIDDKGTLWGVFGDGSRMRLYEIPVAMVDNPAGMLLADGNAWKLSTQSGAMYLYGSGEGGAGTVTSMALESSNVDIGTELTDLIRLQRAYSSNAKIVTTADEMLQEVTNLKR